MSTNEEIEAAIFIIRSKPTIANQYDAAADRLANLVMAEQAERQRRIEAAADKIKDGVFGNCRCGECTLRRDFIRDIITRCLDGETV